ncbi:UNVERIFIED_CONTAM: hypothetical protein PYX00_006132 [Menopon gallinae]|uniref:ATP synthase F0 subunit 8 n=1 Tax=Menopon gallinae TaxID=328185 RepID=A0AAW2HU51_9NEOP
MDESNTLKDVIIPSIIMAVIFIGNTLILLIILHYRKKLDLSKCKKGKDKVADETELSDLRMIG